MVRTIPVEDLGLMWLLAATRCGQEVVGEQMADSARRCAAEGWLEEVWRGVLLNRPILVCRITKAGRATLAETLRQLDAEGIQEVAP